MGVLRKAVPRSGDGVVFAVEDRDAAAALPALYEFLALLRWDDGSPREPGTVLLMAQDGVYKAWLNDRDGDRTAFLSAAGLAELLAVCNDKLLGDSVPWRAVTEKKKGR